MASAHFEYIMRRRKKGTRKYNYGATFQWNLVEYWEASKDYAYFYSTGPAHLKITDFIVVLTLESSQVSPVKNACCR